jgi:glyoxylate carboligase
MSQTVSELLIGVLEQIGVKQIFGLIGDSLNPLADAVWQSKIEWIGVRHEEGATLAAAGQAKLRPGEMNFRSQRYLSQPQDIRKARIPGRSGVPGIQQA